MLFKLSSRMLFQRTGKVTTERVLFSKLDILLPCAFSDLSVSDFVSKISMKQDICPLTVVSIL